MREDNHQIMSPSIESLLPHRPPMRWVDALVDCTETTAVATVRLGEGHLALDDGAVLETALVECVAQTVAAALGERMRAGGQSAARNGGMLAAVSNFKVVSRAEAGQTLTIDTREIKRLGPMLLVTSKITCDGRLVASGELSLYA